MSSVTHFERDDNGQYTRIEQHLDGATIAEGSTFVAFDSVAFAKSTGQTAVTQLVCGKLDNGKLYCVDNRDNRWNFTTSLEDGAFRMNYFGLGSAMVQALKLYGIESPKLSSDRLQVQQSIDIVDGFDFIADGPMDLSSENRYDEGVLLVPLSDASVTPQGGLMAATASRLPRP